MYVPDIHSSSFLSGLMSNNELIRFSRRSVNSRRAKEIACTGSLAPFACESCASLNRLCIVSPLSKCCSSCLALHKGCSLVSEMSYLSLLSEVELLRSQELALETEFVSLTAQMKTCLDQLSVLQRRRASLSSVP